MVSDPDDVAEREAEDLADRALDGQPLNVRAAPRAAISRSVLDWAPGALDSAGQVASSAWDTTTNVGSAA